MDAVPPSIGRAHLGFAGRIRYHRPLSDLPKTSLAESSVALSAARFELSATASIAAVASRQAGTGRVPGRRRASRSRFCIVPGGRGFRLRAPTSLPNPVSTPVAAPCSNVAIGRSGFGLLLDFCQFDPRSIQKTFPVVAVVRVSLPLSCEDSRFGSSFALLLS